MRNRYMLLIDALAVLLSVAVAFVLRLDWSVLAVPDHPFGRALLVTLVLALIVKLPTFYAFGLYARFWRAMALADLLVVALAVTVGSIGLLVAIVGGTLVGVIGAYPRSVPFLDWMVTLLTVAAARVSVRVLADARAASGITVPVDGLKRVLVVGAGEAGSLVVSELTRNPQLHMMPVGFLDDDPAKIGKKILDVRVLGRLDQLADMVSSYKVHVVLIALPTAPGNVVRRVVDDAHRAGVQARALPGMFELLDGGVSVRRLRDVEIADLMRRRPLAITPGTARYLEGQTVLVTGAGGSIGSELSRQIAKAAPARLVLLGHGENSIFDVNERLRHLFPGQSFHPVIADVRDRQALSRTFAHFRPSVVFHAAAHKHVPLMELHAAEAVSNNVLGTAAVVDIAVESGVERLVYVSTDKAVAPASVMGATKRVAEMIVHDAAVRTGRRFVSVRFGNVLGSRGSVVPYFRDQIERGGPITITHPDVTRFFMTIPEAVYLVLKAGGLGTVGDLLVLNMGDPVRIVDLAKDLIGLSGFEERDIPIVFTGLRPGEKLAEHLWEEESRVEPAGGGDVFLVREPAPALEGERLRRAVAALSAAARGGDDLEIHHALSEAVPTFVSRLHGLSDVRH